VSVSFTGTVWVFGDSLDTDAMYPGFAIKMDPPEAAKHVFYEVRPGWTDEVSAGDIVVAGKNFGIGSSRPVSALFIVIANNVRFNFVQPCVHATARPCKAAAHATAHAGLVGQPSMSAYDRFTTHAGRRGMSEKCQTHPDISTRRRSP